MSIGKINRKIGKVKRLRGLYDEAIKDLELELSGKIEFDFYFTHLYGEGFVFVNETTSDYAPMSLCLEAIERDGHLSWYYFDEISI